VFLSDEPMEVLAPLSCIKIKNEMVTMGTLKNTGCGIAAVELIVVLVPHLVMT